MIKVNAAVSFSKDAYNEDFEVSISKFPGGEINVKLSDKNWHFSRPDVTITAHIQNSDILMALMLTADACRRRWPGCVLRLNIPYLPYARQDRVCDEGEALSLSLIGRMINSINAETVTILDAHSEGAVLAINNCVNRSPVRLIRKTLRFISSDAKPEGLVLLSPDAGALKKTYQYAKDLAAAEVIVASKHRDPATGHISHTEVYGDVEGKHILICDDICDGGRTFVELAKKLDEKGVATKTLFVTHGIFSKGYDELASHFDLIVSTNSFHGKGLGEVCPDGVTRSKYYFFEV